MIVVKDVLSEVIMLREELCSINRNAMLDQMKLSVEKTTVTTKPGLSPLIAAGIPCVSSFVFDYTHMVILGVVRSLLIFLTHGPKRLSVRQRYEIFQKLRSEWEDAKRICTATPGFTWTGQVEGYWTTSVFVVLKNVLSSESYMHFLSPTVAMSIMLEPDDRTWNAYLQFTQELMKHFVMCSIDLCIMYMD